MQPSSLRKFARNKLLRPFAAVAIAGLLMGVGTQVQTASADGVSPAQLTEAGWSCFIPPDATGNPWVHCAPPGTLEGVLTNQAPSGMLLSFRTTELTATEAELQGTARMIRVDLFHGQPCPTDPTDDTEEHIYTDLRFIGLDYYVCHSFDSVF